MPLSDWSSVNVAKLIEDAEANVTWTQEVIDKWKATKTEYKRNKEIDPAILKDFLEGCSQYIQQISNIKQFWLDSLKKYKKISQMLSDVANGIPLKEEYGVAELIFGEWKDGKQITKSKVYTYTVFLTDEEYRTKNWEVPTDGKWSEL